MENTISISDYKDLVKPNGEFIQKDVKGDGNCFFSSISVLKYGNEKHHDRIRYEICGYLKCFMDSIETECNRAKEEGVNSYSFPESDYYNTKEGLKNYLKYSIIMNCVDGDENTNTMDLCELTKYGETEQVIGACLMYNINIRVYNDVLVGGSEIPVLNYITNPDAVTYNLYLSNKKHPSGHYNALIPREMTSRPSSDEELMSRALYLSMHDQAFGHYNALIPREMTSRPSSSHNKTKKKSKSPPITNNTTQKKSQKKEITVGVYTYTGKRVELVEYLLQNGATEEAINTILPTKGRIPRKETLMAELETYYMNH